MILNLQIDFDNSYNIQYSSEDLRNSLFTTVLDDGKEVPLYVQISSQSHELMPNVFNLGFGPLKGNRIDNTYKKKH